MTTGRIHEARIDRPVFSASDLGAAMEAWAVGIDEKLDLLTAAAIAVETHTESLHFHERTHSPRTGFCELDIIPGGWARGVPWFPTRRHTPPSHPGHVRRWTAAAGEFLTVDVEARPAGLFVPPAPGLYQVTAAHLPLAPHSAAVEGLAKLADWLCICLCAPARRPGRRTAPGYYVAQRVKEVGPYDALRPGAFVDVALSHSGAAAALRPLRPFGGGRQ